MRRRCVHCNQLKDEFEPLSWGELSDCCCDCWAQYRASAEQWKRDNSPLWAKQREQEQESAAAAEAWKKLSRSERKAAMAGKASGELF